MARTTSGQKVINETFKLCYGVVNSVYKSFYKSYMVGHSVELAKVVRLCEEFQFIERTFEYQRRQFEWQNILKDENGWL